MGYMVYTDNLHLTTINHRPVYRPITEPRHQGKKFLGQVAYSVNLKSACTDYVK